MYDIIATKCALKTTGPLQPSSCWHELCTDFKQALLEFEDTKVDGDAEDIADAISELHEWTNEHWCDDAVSSISGKEHADEWKYCKNVQTLVESIDEEISDIDFDNDALIEKYEAIAEQLVEGIDASPGLVRNYVLDTTGDDRKEAVR